MKSSAGTLVLLGTVLLAGPALAQSAQVNSSGATIAAETRAAPRGGPSAAPGSTDGERLRLINNSETDTAQVEGSYRAVSGEPPVNGIGGLGGGRYSQEAATVTGRVTNAQGQPETAQTQSSGGPVNGIGGTGGGRLPNRTNTDRPSPGGRLPVPGAVQDAAINSSSGEIDVLAWSWGRIDRLNTTEACTARRGVVLMHEGVQQCRLPASARREEGGSAMWSESTTR